MSLSSAHDNNDDLFDEEVKGEEAQDIPVVGKRAETQISRH